MEKFWWFAIPFAFKILSERSKAKAEAKEEIFAPVQPAETAYVKKIQSIIPQLKPLVYQSRIIAPELKVKVAGAIRAELAKLPLPEAFIISRRRRLN